MNTLILIPELDISLTLNLDPADPQESLLLFQMLSSAGWLPSNMTPPSGFSCAGRYKQSFLATLVALHFTLVSKSVSQ